MVIVVPAVVLIMVSFWILIKAFFAVKNKKVQSERIKRRDEYTCQYCKISKASTCQVAFVYRFNHAVFGVKP